jgi:hypothetical protein
VTRRQFRNGQATTLAFPVDGVSTTIVVNSATSFPTQYPYTLILDPDGALEEVVDVTNGTGNNLTIVRGADGTTASAHSAGVQVYHGVSARDADEANAHVNATTNVHGRSGDLVDTASTQSISGAKDFAAITKSGSALVDVTSSQTIGGTKTFSTKPQVTGTALVTTTETQTITGDKTYTGPEAHQGAETHSGTETHSGAETHSGNETHSGTVRISHSVHQEIEVSDDTPISGIVSATFAPGSPVVGTIFVAPPSGRVEIVLSAYVAQTQNLHAMICSAHVREGASIGTGADVYAANSNWAIVAGRAVNASAPALAQGDRAKLITGLTPGATYNVRVEYQTTAGGNGTVLYRRLHIKPKF